MDANLRVDIQPEKGTSRYMMKQLVVHHAWTYPKKVARSWHSSNPFTIIYPSFSIIHWSCNPSFIIIYYIHHLLPDPWILVPDFPLALHRPNSSNVHPAHDVVCPSCWSPRICPQCKRPWGPADNRSWSPSAVAAAPCVAALASWDAGYCGNFLR